VIRAGLLALLFAGTTMAADAETLWEYSDPAASEQRFRAALADAKDDDSRLELQTQIARTYSLRRRFDDAHRLLDQIEPKLARAGTAPRVRYLLERGRTFNSAGDKPRARALFEDAFAQAQAARLEGLAVDAAHMVAITHGGSDAAVEWNRRGLALARASSDPKARALISAMLNNGAWDLLDQGRAADALPWFDDALVAWRERARPAQIRIAQWSRAHALRKLGRHADALAQLEQLRAEHSEAAERDGFVHEEQAENLLAVGRAADAAPAFAAAARLLAADGTFAQAHRERLERLRQLGGVARDEVFAAERAFARSMAERDAAAFARHLDDEAVFFGPVAPVLRGKPAVIAGWQRFYEGKDAPFSWEPDQVEVLAGGTLALSTGPVRDPQGKVVARFNSIWRRTADGRWLVVFDKGGPPDPPLR
jgi:ketosteroid isomerase-like protein